MGMAPLPTRCGVGWAGARAGYSTGQAAATSTTGATDLYAGTATHRPSQRRATPLRAPCSRASRWLPSASGATRRRALAHPPRMRCALCAAAPTSRSSRQTARSMRV
eukprot:scaffold261270_cov23-Tisochrysis_lutea.AAC.2